MYKFVFFNGEPLMFTYVSSFIVTFILLGVAYNIGKNIKPNSFTFLSETGYWILIGVLSAIWPISVPVLGVICITYLLKLLVDKISQFILKRVKK